MDLLSVYERMILSDLRPSLAKYADEKGLDDLEKEFYSFVFRPEKDDVDKTLERLISMMPTFKLGDTLKIETDQQSGKISVQKNDAPDEEQLINLDIMPPDDRKGEVYLRIIEDQFQVITRSLVDNLSSNSSGSKLKVFAQATIAKAKHLAHEAHFFEKRLRSAGTESAKSSMYVTDLLKKYLMYVILEVQRLYAPFIKVQQKEWDLEDELFEMKATRSSDKSKRLRAIIDQKHLKRLYEQVGINASQEEKIAFFKSKVEEEFEDIAEAGSVYVYQMDNLELYLAELGQLLKTQLSDKLLKQIQSEQYKSHLEVLLKTEAGLLADKEAVEYKALSKTDFFEKLAVQIKLLRDLLALNSSDGRDILCELIKAAMVAQSRFMKGKDENQINTEVVDQLRARNFDVSDQTLHGRSGKGKKYGSLDIAIRDKNDSRVVTAIVESFILKSCGPSNNIVGDHLKRLTESYNPAGNKESYALIYAKSKDFEKLWSTYKGHVDGKVFKRLGVTTDVELGWVNFSNIKVGMTETRKRNVVKKIYHIFIKMQS